MHGRRRHSVGRLPHTERCLTHCLGLIPGLKVGAHAIEADVEHGLGPLRVAVESRQRARRKRLPTLELCEREVGLTRRKTAKRLLRGHAPGLEVGV